MAQAHSFAHDSLVYRSDQEMVDNLEPFLREGVEAGDPVAVVMPSARMDVLRDALGSAAAGMHFIDNEGFYEHPARTIALVDEVRASLLEGRSGRLRHVGEIAFGSDAGEQQDWLRYEAVLNHALADASQWTICTYDARILPKWVLDGASRTHPHVHRDGRRIPSEKFVDPATSARDLCPPPPQPIGAATLSLQVGSDSHAEVRRQLTRRLVAAGVDSDRAAELALGLNEVVTNAIEHGGGQAHVRCWHEPVRVCCEVVDDGPGVDDPFAGFCPPAPEQLGGRGLWVTRQIFDDVHLESGTAGGLRALLTASL